MTPPELLAAPIPAPRGPETGTPRPAYEAIPIVETHEPMMELSAFPFLALPVYFHNEWSPSADMFAREGLLDKLARVQARHLTPRGLKWVVYDAWRPRQVQAAIYQHYWRVMSRANPKVSRDELSRQVLTYVSLPAHASRTPPHSTGGSIDLGWWDSHTGELVDMGSAFDEFCPQAASDYFERTDQGGAIAARRRELAAWLTEEGLVGDEHEWFHKDWGNQKWALQTDAPRALYGEVLSCKFRSGRTHVEWGCDEAAQHRTQRIAALAASLDLTHPAVAKTARLSDLQELLAVFVANSA